ncbi:SufE family protein [Shewanella phaeophyticola]|uniref:SufE family protein n=1 Tax=Shewanella phaeophyticola TaxID=2978345 RepID=A0ABT2NYE6_9GAMM|nr:SufE family protein [Shewanella sp. KJ10-1]MCT8985428.1 SufE family protein [Shewanella sp. KJ10-1]
MSPSKIPESQLFTVLPAELTSAVTQIEQAKSWQDKYRHIMLLGKQLPALTDEFKQDNAQVKGCESQAWLYHHQKNDQHFYLADSDARIVKGLIAILLVATQGKTTEQISQFEVTDYFDRLGLSGQLSPSRTNGLNALAEAIKRYAKESVT